MSIEPKRQGDELRRITPQLRFARFGELRIYPVDERDLDALASGSPATLELNLAIAFLSICVTLMVTLATATVADRVYVAFFIVLVVTFIVGVVLAFRSARSHRSSRAILRDIKSRMNKNQMEEDLADAKQKSTDDADRLTLSRSEPPT